LPEDLKVKKEDYNRMTAYSKSKLMNVLFTKELARRLESRNIKVVALHPGFVKTNIGQGDSSFFIWALTKAILLFVHGLLARNVDEGAKTTVFTATDDSIVSGEYYDSCKIGEAQPQCYDTELAKKLWDLSADLAGISPEIPSN
jgi:NAD(P)-dependent dehydrogenase (short-subunit alcohol dehydrogenase family)